MLSIDLGALKQGPINISQAVPADDPLFETLDFELGAAVELGGRLMETGPRRYFWQGELRTLVKAACRRCLAPVDLDVVEAVQVLFTEDADADDPAAYVIPERATELDLGEAVREELILATPEYALCREECRGLCAGCGTDLNIGTCTCKPEPDPRWGALEALKTARPEHEGH